MLASIAEGESVIENYLSGEDCMRTVTAFKRMGVMIRAAKNTLAIKGVGLNGLEAPAKAIDAGNSGTTVRLMSGILAAQGFSTEIFGDESLSKRPMKRIITPLELMGAKFTARDGNYLPMTIQGNPGLKPIHYDSPVASAQIKSSVLFAGLFAKGETSFTEPVKSRDHTERMLKAFGADVKVDMNKVTVRGPSKLKAHSIRVPGDISSAAFALVAACFASEKEICLKNVCINPTRSGIIEILNQMSAQLRIANIREASGEPVADLFVKRSHFRKVLISSVIIPRLIDELPIIALAATQAEGTTVISGAKELRVKESDRIKSVTDALKKMGANVTEKEDGMVIVGQTKLRGAEIDSLGDHRLAMMAAVAGLIAEGGVTVTNVECVETSYPGFVDDMKKIGANIEVSGKS